jgi:hypothetical protein
MGIAGNTLTLPPIRTHRLPPDATKSVFYKDGQPFTLDIPRGTESATVNGVTGEVTFNMPNPAPWIVIGTTTLDGLTDEQFTAATNTSLTIDDVIRSGQPFPLGGRALIAKGVRTFSGTTMLFCDIVRRQSEIDAERFAHEQAIVNGLMRVHMGNHQCPECGPHGNRGRVQLNFIEVACTVCAGGVSGDAFGMVEEPGPTVEEACDELAIMIGRPDDDWFGAPNHAAVRRQEFVEAAREHMVSMKPTTIQSDAMTGRAPSGFKMPTPAEFDNYMKTVRAGIVDEENSETWRWSMRRAWSRHLNEPIEE